VFIRGHSFFQIGAVMTALPLLLLLAAPSAPPSPVEPILTRELPDLLDLYRHLHANPELSLHEEKTAWRLAAELRTAGFDVTVKVGGHGVVGVLKNGNGPTVLVRTDMDALPITERTGLPYTSQVPGVMHACGHDIHMTSWVGTARTLAALKDKWAGTLVFVAQPAEEIGAGSKAMLADGLFKRFPRPDYALALHTEPRLPAGVVAFTDGMTMANVDSVDITVKGKGGHGAAPHTTIDPVVLAARVVLDLQTIVSREVNPTDPAVVTVGSIHGGTKHNIIPNEVKLQLTVRTTKDSVREQVLKAIDRITRAAAAGANAPEPEVKVSLDMNTPAVLNEPKLTRRVTGVFRDLLGPEYVRERLPLLVGEDFSRYGREGVPSFLYFLGTAGKDQYEAAQKPGALPLPGMHTDDYAPVPEPSIRAGVTTMTAAVLDLTKPNR
jgi:amidohydrolase